MYLAASNRRLFCVQRCAAVAPERLKQDVSGAVAERVFEFMGHQAISIDTQPFQDDWPPRHE